MADKLFTLGIDVGGSYIKTVLMDYSSDPVVIDKRTEKIRKRNPLDRPTFVEGNYLPKSDQN